MLQQPVHSFIPDDDLAASPATVPRARSGGLLARLRWPRRVPVWRGPIGLELSQETLNLVQFEARGGWPRLTAVATLPLPCTRTQLMEDPSAFARLLRDARRQARLRGRVAVSCLPPSLLRLSLVNYRLKRGESDAVAVTEAARERLGGELTDWIIDFLPVRTRGEGEGDRAALLAAAQRADVFRYLELLRAARLEVAALDVGPAAVARVVASATTDDTKANVLTANVGREYTYLTVFSGRRLILDREVAMGRHALTSAVATGLDIGQEEAESLLVRYGLGPGAASAAAGAASGPADGAREDATVAATLSEILRARLVDLRDEIAKAALYAASHTRGSGISQVLLLGAAARWPGVDTLLGNVLELPVAILDPLYGIDVAEGVEVPRDAGVLSGLTNATGCALRGCRVDA